MSTRSAQRTGAAATAAVLALALSACGGQAEADGTTTEPPAASGTTASGPVVVEHAQGTTELAGVPEKVFVFDYATVGVLTALGVEVDGVPKENVPAPFAELGEDEDVVDVGTLFEPDYETVAAEAPDLVVVGGRSAEALPELEKIAPTVDLSSDQADPVASAIENAETLGAIFGKQAEAAELVAALEGSLADVRATAAEAGDALLLMTSGGNINAYGDAGRFGFLFSGLGLTEAVDVAEEGRHGQAVSPEFILETDPDWIFVIDRDSATGGAEAARAVMDTSVVERTTASREGRIVYLDSTLWYVVGGGVWALQAMADEVGAALRAQG